MFRLSETDRIKAISDARRTLTAHTNSVLPGRVSTREEKEGGILALMSIQWATGLVREVGAGPLRKLLKRVKNDICTSGECKIFRDMLAQSTGDTIPIYASAWRIWHELIIRLRLFEIAEIREWVTLVARFDSKGIRTPRCMARIPFDELSRIYWERTPPPPHPPHDIILMTW